MDITFLRVVMLILTSWLFYIASTNIPIARAGLGQTESHVWPLLVTGACVVFAAAQVIDLVRRSRFACPAALVLGALTAGLALRLTVLPLGETLAPTTLTGVREGLAIFAASYFIYVLLLWSRAARGAAP